MSPNRRLGVSARSFVPRVLIRLPPPSVGVDLHLEDLPNGLHDKLPHPNALTVSRKSTGDNCRGDFAQDRRLILPFDKPVMSQAGFLHLKGTLFDSAIMKTSVISPAFREKYLSYPNDPMAFEGPVAVFDGPEDNRHRIENEPEIHAGTILVMRRAGPVGYPGAAEMVNMIPPGRLIKDGIELPCIGDGRQTGTSGSPSILNASPEAPTGGMLGYLKDGDRLRIDLLKREAAFILTPEQIVKRKEELGPYEYPPHQTPWQEIYRNQVSELSEGMVLKDAVKYQRISKRFGGSAGRTTRWFGWMHVFVASCLVAEISYTESCSLRAHS